MEPIIQPQPQKNHESINPFVYALGEFGLGITGNVIGLLSLFFYSDVMGLSASLAALARTINGVWDGVNDPCSVISPTADETSGGGNPG